MMELERIIKKLLKMITKISGVMQLDEKMDFKEYMDSIEYISLVVEAETEFVIQICDEGLLIDEVKNVKELAEKIQTLIKNKKMEESDD